MPAQITIALGKKHFLFQQDEAEGARCAFIPDGPLCLAVFVPNPTPEELRPSTVRLGLLVYHRSIFLVLDVDGSYCDMPYIHPLNVFVFPVPPGYGLDCSLTICDQHGIVRSMGARSLTNKFTNAFLEATHLQQINPK